MVSAVRKVNAWLKRNSPEAMELRALRNYCKEDFLKDLQLLAWSSILESKSEKPSEMASTFMKSLSIYLIFMPLLKKEGKKRVRSVDYF